MMELVLSRENLLSALHRVESNKGSHGVDGMSVKELRNHIQQNWHTIRESIENGTYHPSPVRRVEIPKPNGGTRLLGIPTVMDRFIQQAITQVLTPVFDPTFSEHSYGFRPQRRGHDAVRKARQFMQNGYRIVVDIDLEKFFDRVNHDRLMAKLAEYIDDKILLGLIRKYLQSGAMIQGIVQPTEEGAPQGGPSKLHRPLVEIAWTDYHRQTKNVKKAMEICKRALSWAEEVPIPWFIIKARRRLGELLCELGQFEIGCQVLEHAASYAENLQASV